MQIIYLSQKCTRSQSAYTRYESRKQVYRASCVRRERLCPPPAPRAPSAAPGSASPRALRARQPVSPQLADAVRPVSRHRRAAHHVSPAAPLTPAHLCSQSRETRRNFPDLSLWNLNQISGSVVARSWTQSDLSAACVECVVEPVHLVSEADCRRLCLCG